MHLNLPCSCQLVIFIVPSGLSLLERQSLSNLRLISWEVFPVMSDSYGVSCREQSLTVLCPVTCAGIWSVLHLSLPAFHNAGFIDLSSKNDVCKLMNMY